MFRLLGDWLAEFVDIRDQLNQRSIDNLEDFEDLTEQLEHRIHETGFLKRNRIFKRDFQDVSNHL